MTHYETGFVVWPPPSNNLAPLRDQAGFYSADFFGRQREEYGWAWYDCAGLGGILIQDYQEGYQ